MYKDNFQLNLRSEQQDSHYNTVMVRVLHAFGSRARRFIRKFIVRFACQIIRLLMRNRSNRIQISFAAKNMNDGLGAQIQRQLSIEALSNFLSICHIPSPLEQIAIHPLDSFQTLTQMQAFLGQVNRAFDFNATGQNNIPVTHQITRLTIWKLVRLAVLSRFVSKPIHISTCEVYGIVDFLPDFYLKNLPPNRVKIDFNLPGGVQKFICIHFRQGVGGKVIYPGQKLPRELDVEYFINVLSKTNCEGKRIYVLTDAPVSSMTYRPVKNQIHLWDGTPKFSDGEMSITGLDLKNAFRLKGFDVEVVSGGDPLFALFLMMNCDTLIMSRSSLSYTAAILNSSATIYYPPGFWHPPMSSWRIPS